MLQRFIATLHAAAFFLACSTSHAGGGAKVGSDPARLARLKDATMPKVDKVINFDTPEADAILSALEVFPPDNAWNLVV